MLEIKLRCCEGDPNRRCYGVLCPYYGESKDKAVAQTPYIGTGFGNLNPEPSHGEILRRVRDIIKKIEGK